MTHYIVHYEPVDVMANSVEDAILKVKNIAPDINRVEVALQDKHNSPMQSMQKRKC